MKTNEIIDSLRYCQLSQHTDCWGCPANIGDSGCLDALHKDAADTIEAQQKRIEELEAERRWIPVTERLPEKWWNKGDDAHEADPTEFIVFIDGALVPTVLYFNGESFLDDAGVPYEVTHWMPLPEPPEEVV